MPTRTTSYFDGTSLSAKALLSVLGFGEGDDREVEVVRVALHKLLYHIGCILRTKVSSKKSISVSVSQMDCTGTHDRHNLG